MADKTHKSGKTGKIRLDVLVAQRDLAPSREAARRMIMAGEVRVDGEVRDKPGMRVAPDAVLDVRADAAFCQPGRGQAGGGAGRVSRWS